jgi:release factor glutamine methyltransferase
MYYEPSEDSELLAQASSSYARLTKPMRVLEVGVGSGYVLERIDASERCGTDLNPMAVIAAHERVSEADIRLGDLTEPFDGPFDLIVCNPPYLPADWSDRFLSEDVRSALIGGTSGIELSLRLIREASDKLARDGAMLIIVSSHADPKRFEYEAVNLGYTIGRYCERRLPGLEDLTCYVLTHNDVSRYAIDAGYRLAPLTRGGRSVLYVLTPSRGSGASRIAAKLLLGEKASYAEHEFEMLRAVKDSIRVPEPIGVFGSFFTMEYIEAETLADVSDEERSRYDDQLIAAALALDRLRIKKYEFTRPYGNILVNNGTLVFTDFERAAADKQGNTTQLLEHFRRRGSISMDTMRSLAEAYLKDCALASVDETAWQKRILESLG